MPKCKNDQTRSYMGNEPSPKGFGFCAHAEKMNSKLKGKDGNLWKVGKTKTNVKRWVKITTATKRDPIIDKIAEYYNLECIDNTWRVKK